MRRIIFVCINMNIGGTEKALLELLGQMSLEENDITLLMLEQYGGFLDKIPSGIKVKYLKGYESIKPLIKRAPIENIKTYIKEKKWKKAVELLVNYIVCKLSKSKIAFYHYLFKEYKTFDEEYDLAIAYAGPMELITYLVAYYIKAKKKIQWIHFDVTKIGFNLSFAKKVYKAFDKIFVVSNEGKEKMIKALPDFKEKIEVFHNCINKSQILEQANEDVEMERDSQDNFQGVRLLTVGRLSKEKGQDYCIEAVAKLKQEGYKIKWYAIGEGSEKIYYQQLAEQLNVKEECVFLGAKANPYPYMKACDIYIQPSRHEGYCITLAEAKLFAHPIVTTDFTGAAEQIENEKTGLIVKGESEALYRGIKQLLDDSYLYEQISRNLAQVQQEHKEEIHKLYEVLEEPKKKILFMVSSLNVGGVEKSLLSLLNALPRKQYEITILTLEKKGDFLEYVPPDINIEEVGWYRQIKPLLMASPYENIYRLKGERAYLKCLTFIVVYFWTKVTKNRYFYLKHILKDIPNYKKQIDVAIAYAGPTEIIDTYILYKTKAKKKVGWIHFDLTKVEPNYKLYRRLYHQFNHLFVVSYEAKQKMLEYLPNIVKQKENVEVLRNIISSTTIQSLAMEQVDFDKDYEGFKIVTVGRLSWEKGQDLAIKVLARLIKEGEEVRWYCVGDGKDREAYQRLIAEYGLEQHFILLGAKTNPYPYIKQANLYVQTSRHEGFCLTLAEAKCLHKAIVTTYFTGAEEQIRDEENGYIVEPNEEALYEKIKELLHHLEKREVLEAQLQIEDTDTTKEVYKLIDYIEGAKLYES